MSSVTAQYFVGDNSYNFTTVLGQQPLFIQNYPSMSFNPRPGIVIGNPDTSYQNPPWSNVTTDLNGNYTGTLLPQGNGFIVGDTTMPSFNGVFTGELHVAVAGNYTIRTYHDDGFFWGVGGCATRVGGWRSGAAEPDAGHRCFHHCWRHCAVYFAGA